MSKLLHNLRKPHYDLLPDIEEEAAKTEDNTSRQHKQQSFDWYWPTICASLLALNVLQYTYVGRPSSFERGFTTDFDDARRAIALEQRKFTGWISWNSTAEDVYRVLDSGPQFFGPPSEAMDAAWDDLLYGQYVAMTLDEAARYPGIVTSATTSKYHMQPDVYHSLHCLNAIRIELEPEYYAAHPRPDADIPVPPSWPSIHRDHCLDQIRQSLQCNADLSPAPFFAWEGLHLSIAEGRTHTCRKWDGIRDWVLERDRLSASVPGD